jgi:hypothetical protein
MLNDERGSLSEAGPAMRHIAGFIAYVVRDNRINRAAG